MRTSKRSLKKGSFWIVPLLLGGCAAALPLFPIVMSLGGTALAVFVVAAGVPTLERALLSIPQDDRVDLIGRGNITLDPSVITLRQATGGGSKRNTTAQQAPTCADACAAAGVNSDTCTSVCSESQIEITVWVADPADEDTVCTGGDRDTYGPYLVTLDENGNGVAVSPTEVSLTARTILMIKNGQMATCVRVVAPDDGEVLLDSFTVNVGL